MTDNNKAILILAAGLGSRLNPHSKTTHKTLSLVNETPLILHQIRHFIQYGVSENDIYIAIGYLGDSIQETISLEYPKVQFIRNKEYESTNNMVSLYLTCKAISGKKYTDFYILNGDNLYEDKMIEAILNVRHQDFLAYKKDAFNEENMKIQCNEQGAPTLLGKEILKQNSVGLSNDCFKISADSFLKLMTIMESFIIQKNEKNLWMEYAFIELFKQVSFSLLDCSAYKWIEVDTIEDLEAAENLFSKQLSI